MHAPPPHAARTDRHAAERSAGSAALFAGLALLWLTGIGLWASSPDREPGDALAGWHHPSFVIHVVLAWCAVYALGRWAWPHVARRAARPGRRTSGWPHALGWLVVALSGIGLQVLPEATRGPAFAAHWWLGLALPAAAVVHAVRRRPRHR